MSLPNGGRHEDVVRKKEFEKYIRDHVEDWFTWAQNNKLGVKRLEDILFVSGCTLVTSWAAAVFLDNNMEAKITLASKTLSNGGTSFIWSNIQGPVVYHSSSFDPVRSPGYVCSARANFFFVLMESKIHPRLRINASSSGVSERKGPSCPGHVMFQTY